MDRTSRSYESIKNKAKFVLIRNFLLINRDIGISKKGNVKIKNKFKCPS